MASLDAGPRRHPHGRVAADVDRHRTAVRPRRLSRSCRRDFSRRSSDRVLRGPFSPRAAHRRRAGGGSAARARADTSARVGRRQPVDHHRRRVGRKLGTLRLARAHARTAALASTPAKPRFNDVAVSHGGWNSHVPVRSRPPPVSKRAMAVAASRNPAAETRSPSSRHRSCPMGHSPSRLMPRRSTSPRLTRAARSICGRFPAAGGAAAQLTSFSRDTYAPSVAAEGTVLFKVQSYRTVVAQAPADGGPTEPLATFRSETPSWDPTGQFSASPTAHGGASSTMRSIRTSRRRPASSRSIPSVPRSRSRASSTTPIRRISRSAGRRTGNGSRSTRIRSSPMTSGCGRRTAARRVGASRSSVAAPKRAGRVGRRMGWLLFDGATRPRATQCFT